MGEDSGLGMAAASGDAGDDWKGKGPATSSDDWENKATETPAFGVSAPIAATGGW